MTDIDTDTLLFDARKRLVEAAERAINDSDNDQHPKKSQFNHLAALCNEASCQEEIINFLRYQASRRSPPLQPKFAELVIDQITKVTASIEADMKNTDKRAIDSAKVKAWRLYAVYLMRAFTYAHPDTDSQGQDRDHQERNR